MVLTNHTKKFIEMSEKTKMTKSYKMPVLLSFLQDNRIHEKISIDDLAVFFRHFYTNPIYRIDLNDLIHKDFDDWSLLRLKEHILKNPIYAFLNTAKDIFILENGEFRIRPNVYKELVSNNSHRLIRDVVKQRLSDYYERKHKVKV
jgi:hypothetical protein